MTRGPVVLVTDGHRRTALAVVRSLGRAGYTVCVAAPSRWSIAGASRYAHHREVVADAAASPARFVEDVARAVHRRGVDIVIPVADASLLTLGRSRGRFATVCIPWPDAETVQRVADKATVIEAARGIGIAVPAQRVAETAAEAMTAARDLRFPLVLKPSRSVREQTDGRFEKLSVTHAADSAQLASNLAEMGVAAFPLLLQERIVGPGVGVSLLLWDGRQLGHFAHRRIREHPPAGGISVYAESIVPDPDLVERSISLLNHFGWRGVAMVEYKVDAVSGTPYLMEVNGRFWGSLQLAIDAGVDFPALLVAAARGITNPATDYRVGVVFRSWWGDVDHLLLRLARSPARLAMPPGAPSRASVVRAFIAAGWPARASDVLRADDPRPFVVETVGWLRERVVRWTRGAARGARRTVRGWRTSSPAGSELA